MDKASVGRIIALSIVVANAVLNIFGFKTIPVAFGDHITAAVLIAISLYAAWKNNYLSRKGRKQKEVLKQNNLK